jgi:predicted histidine transporter YuiF (NhaC family)
MTPSILSLYGPFIALAFAVAMVSAGLRRERARDIIVDGLKLFAVLIVGFVVVCAAIYVLGDPVTAFRTAD